MSRLANHIVAFLLCGVIVTGQVPAWLHAVNCESTSQCHDQASGCSEADVVSDGCECSRSVEPESDGCPFELRRERQKAQSHHLVCDSSSGNEDHEHPGQPCPCEHDHDSDTCAVCQTLASAPGLIQFFQTCCDAATSHQSATVFDSVMVDDEQFSRLRTRGPPTV